MVISLHRTITRKAIDTALPELKQSQKRRVIAGNLRVDTLSWFHYRRACHVDRIPLASHRDGWEMGLLALRERELKVLRLSANGSRRRLYYEVGALLHTLQDFYSHSNYTDLSPGKREAFDQALFTREAMPEGVKICSWNRFQALRKDRDGYRHREHARDRPGEEAVETGALTVSVRWLERLRGILFPADAAE